MLCRFRLLPASHDLLEIGYMSEQTAGNGNGIRKGGLIMKEEQRKPSGPAPEYIEAAHQLREQFLQAIQHGNQQFLRETLPDAVNKLRDAQLNILNRIPNDKLRSMKNILLSHNTLYSYSAEKGGLSAWQSHFLSEKYAIMIEHANTLTELEQIHSNMVFAYSDPAIRTSSSKSLTIVEQAEQFVEMYFTEDFSMEEMAERLHVHPSHLMRAFKKAKGITIGKYRNQRRIKEAKQLIQYSNLTMTEIAIMVGFSSAQYFSTIFKELEGITPLEFKMPHY